jgi:uncharacterized protein
VSTSAFLVVHGWENRRPEGHWQRWLAGRLAEDGHAVRYPQFPAPDEPRLEEWRSLLRSELGALDGEERVLVCHSLAVLLWWTTELDDVRPDRVLLVAPPSPAVMRTFPEITAFAPDDGAGPVNGTRAVRLVGTDDDEYCPGGHAAVYGEPFGIDVDVIPGGRHLDLPAGYGSWPSVLAWCTDPAVRITGR